MFDFAPGSSEEKIAAGRCSRQPRFALKAVLSLLCAAFAIATAPPPICRADPLTTLHSFSSRTDGVGPSVLIQACDGSLYGTTGEGLPYIGTVFKFDPGGALITLYDFNGPAGTGPQTGLMQASDGNFYGTTIGRPVGSGTIFKITSGGTFTTLHSFNSLSFGISGTNSDGAVPSALIQASDGNLYGTTYFGGATGAGTIFRITRSGILTTLYNFSGTDGEFPQGGLIQASDGNLYGTTAGGGGTTGWGTVFRITLSGTLTTLYIFSGGADGNAPNGLIQASDGNFYGTTWKGGSYGNGTSFKITPNGTFTSLYSFSQLSTGPNGTNSDGANPLANLTQAYDGNLYGMTSQGGITGFGTVFQITLGGAFTILHSFGGYPVDGSDPATALIQARDGNLYGTTSGGGANGQGTIFQLNIGLLPLYRLDGLNGGHLLTTDPNAQNAPGSFGWTTQGDVGFVYNGPNDAPNLIPLYSLYSFFSGDHLYTTDSTERDTAVENGYLEQGVTGYVFASASTNSKPLYRLFDPATGQHLFTGDPAEYNAMPARWNREGVAAYVLTAPPRALYRLFNPATGKHLLTANQAEQKKLALLGWNSEGAMGLVFPGAADAPNLIPLYHLYNIYSGDHLYTISAAECSADLVYGYVPEGVSGYVFGANAPGLKPLYRLYNWATGQHLFTGNPDEYNGLPAPWHQEGIAGYIQ